MRPIRTTYRYPACTTKEPTMTERADDDWTRGRLELAARNYHNTRDDLERRRERLALCIAAAVAEGMSEVEASHLAGVSRMTVRAWLGKGK